MIFVIDASVASKWFVTEANSDLARQLLLDSSNEFIAPDLFQAELLNVLWKHVRAANIDAQEAQEIVSRVGGYFASLVSMDILAPRAFRIALDLQHPVYDCFYLALAELRDCPMVTADNRLHRAVQGSEWAKRTRLLG